VACLNKQGSRVAACNDEARGVWRGVWRQTYYRKEDELILYKHVEGVLLQNEAAFVVHVRQLVHQTLRYLVKIARRWSKGHDWARDES